MAAAEEARGELPAGFVRRFRRKQEQQERPPVRWRVLRGLCDRPPSPARSPSARHAGLYSP